MKFWKISTDIDKVKFCILNFQILKSWWHMSRIFLELSSSSPWMFSRLSSRASSLPGICPMNFKMRKVKCGFTPACTMAKRLAVAFSFHSSLYTKEHQTQTFTTTEASWLIITRQCYIKEISAESVCLSSHLRMVSDSVTSSPGPGAKFGNLKVRMRIDLAFD